MYKLVKTKEYLKAEKKYGNQLKATIPKMERHLQQNPTYHANIVLVQGTDNLYRYHLGPYRVTYTVEANIVTVTLLDLEPRGGAYR